MAYQALYRTWRPADFASMVGQETTIATLRNQVATGRIAHAYLFCGSRGTGKTSAAKILSRAVNCEQPVNGDPCGVCPTCQRILHEESLDVLEIDAASNNGVDEIRDLRETVKYPPQNGRYKVYIIDEVHMLSASAFNALLKTLEEPPGHVLFILATTEPQKLPATILSRCQRFDFKRIPAQQITGRLRQVVEGAGAEADETALRLIARAAEGGMRDALSILDMCLGYQPHVDDALVRSVLGTADKSFLFRFARSLMEEDAAGLMKLVDELMRSGREPIVFAKDVAQHLRCLLMAKSCPGDLAELLETTEEDAADYIRQAEGFTHTRLLSMMELFMAVETDLRYASSPRIALENAGIKACLRTGEEDTAALLERIEELEKTVKALREQVKEGVVIRSGEGEKPHAGTPKKTSAPPQMQEQAPVVDENDMSVWKKMTDALRKNDPMLFSFISQGKFAGCEDDCFHWEGLEIYANMLNKEEKRDKVAAALTQARGAASRFQAHTAGTYHPGGKPAEETPDAADHINDLLESFGRGNIDIVEEMPGPSF